VIDSIQKYQNTPSQAYQFSLLIPSWNNLDYLKLCIGSIRKNSFYELQIIVIVNEGSDGSLEWVQNQKDIDFVYAKENIGICYALNAARSLIQSDYVVYINDDMYLLPNWDLALEKEITALGTKKFMLSGTMVEPIDTGNKCVIVKDYGRDIDSFKENLLLQDYPNLHKDNWSGSTWPPNVVHVDVWDLVGGLSVEFSPGMGSDPDFAKKLYEAGVRQFKGVGASLVYHFGTKSTKRVNKNDGRKTFLHKWGISQRDFSQKYLKIGEPFAENVSVPQSSLTQKIVSKIKIIISYF